MKSDWIKPSVIVAFLALLVSLGNAVLYYPFSLKTNRLSEDINELEKKVFEISNFDPIISADS